VRELDLHGHTKESALRRLAQELHAARVLGETALRVITGRGIGNDRGEPVLRDHVERWLAADGRRLGVKVFRRASHGGALDVELAKLGEPRR
jgi:DNA-nicking Smr family endonuclease